jgi:hypothetical protein
MAWTREQRNEYMRNYYKKKKEEKSDGPHENPDKEFHEDKIEDKVEDKVEEVAENVVQSDSKPKRKKKKMEIPFSPEGFADFSVSLEKTTLAFRKSKLDAGSEKHIENSAKTLAELYEIPKALAIADYGLAMVLPHITITLDRVTAKQELEMVKLMDDLESKGFHIDRQMFMLMNENERNKYISNLQKQENLRSLKKQFNKEDVIIE